MAATRDVSSDTTTRDERYAAVAVSQLTALFGAHGVAHYYAVADPDKWDELLVWAGPARRYVERRGRVAVDVIELQFGAISVHVQGPTREPTLDDFRRLRAQRDAEEG